MRGVLILKLLGKKHRILVRHSVNSAAKGLSRTQETDPLALPSLHLEFPLHQHDAVSPAFTKPLTLASSVRDLARS